ncbi:hypothetical protein Y1Q_0007297 [Alligator mississippiensis]|uniref:Uncharacterized protein n=1 Tax=Alligator mississippiensis TaxID=8496 RepID=A0A151NNG6_ALLMI|nr:hypothetical protein Y1Q_0007297 [Alligator mississippiensis]
MSPGSSRIPQVTPGPPMRPILATGKEALVGLPVVGEPQRNARPITCPVKGQNHIPVPLLTEDRHLMKRNSHKVIDI